MPVADRFTLPACLISAPHSAVLHGAGVGGAGAGGGGGSDKVGEERLTIRIASGALAVKLSSHLRLVVVWARMSVAVVLTYSVNTYSSGEEVT